MTKDHEQATVLRIKISVGGWAVVEHSFNPRVCMAETSASLRVPGQRKPVLQNKTNKRTLLGVTLPTSNYPVEPE